MTDSKIHHIVLTGNLDAAITDWEPRLRVLFRTTLIGEDHDGRVIRFVTPSNPDRLRGIKIDSYEVHPTALRARGYRDAKDILTTRVLRNVT